MIPLLGLFPIALMVYAMAGLFFPKIRGHWKKGSIPMGVCSSIGLSLFFGGTGFLILLQNKDVGLFNSIFALSANLGVFLTVLGLIIDVITSKLTKKE